jgi:ribosomal protein L21E
MNSNQKYGIMAGMLAICVAMLMSMPVGSATVGTQVKTTLFSDNFDVDKEINYNKWNTGGNRSWYGTSYQSMDCSFDTYYYDASNWNWSQGIWTRHGVSNDTIYMNSQLYLKDYFYYDLKVWQGLIDNHYVNSTGMIANYTGICGVTMGVTSWEAGEPILCSQDQQSPLTTYEYGYFVNVWWVDNDYVYHEYNTSLTYMPYEWYQVGIVYHQDTNSATVNITDTVTQEKVSKTVTHLKHLRGDVDYFNYGIAPYFGFGLSKGNSNGIYETLHEIDSLYLVDSVELYAMKTVTPATPAVQKNWAQEIGIWTAVIGAAVVVMGLLNYSYTCTADLDIWQCGYDSIIVISIGATLCAVGGAAYYGVFGAVHQFWVIIGGLI